MKNNHPYLKIILTLTTLILFSSTIHAMEKGNLRFGKFLISPEFIYSPQYNDNIYADPDNEKDDLIHLLKPSININYTGFTGMSGNSVNIGCQSMFGKYSDYTDNDYSAYQPYFTAQWKTPMGLYIKSDDVFLKTSDPYGDLNEYAVGKPKTKRWSNDFNFITGYDFPQKLALEGLFNNYQLNYDDQEDEWQDRTNNGFGASILYRVTPKTSGLFQYRRDQTKYDSQNDGIYDLSLGTNWSSSTSQDFDTDTFLIGTRFEPGGKLSGELKLGYGSIRFENDVSPLGTEYKSESDMVAETSIEYAVLERSKIRLLAERLFEASAEEDSGAARSTNFSLGLIQGFRNQISGNFSLGLKNIDYINEPQNLMHREFNIYEAVIGVKWEFVKYFNAGAEYRYRKKNATESFYNYDEYATNVFALSLGAQF